MSSWILVCESFNVAESFAFINKDYGRVSIVSIALIYRVPSFFFPFLDDRIDRTSEKYRIIEAIQF